MTKINNPNFDLSNTTALITGAAGLMGVEHTIALINSGANVIMTDLNMKSLEIASNIVEEKTGVDPISIPMDVTSENNVEEVKDRLIESGHVVSILINNAAIDPKVNSNKIKETSRFENFSTEDWDFQFDVGLKGAFICSKIFGHEMAKNNQGVIVNIASDLSIFAPDQRLYRVEGLSDDVQPVKPVTYSVIKHGLIGLTKYIASYWADKGVRCNALSPGGIFNNQNDTFVSRLEDLIPMGRMATKEEYHGCIQFLCSDASKYMNGQNIVVDGGRSIL